MTHCDLVWRLEVAGHPGPPGNFVDAGIFGPHSAQSGNDQQGHGGGDDRSLIENDRQRSGLDLVELFGSVCRCCIDCGAGFLASTHFGVFAFHFHAPLAESSAVVSEIHIHLHW